ncbi:MAG: hypothetical protein BWZ00_01685 [Bacteroidetes bacterium ADurb.BinA174]|nr:MAG: hypothetical protein BWZ00_01685 [Bacteroidetes bacterium ADurb.BinA174]
MSAFRSKVLLKGRLGFFYPAESVMINARYASETEDRRAYIGKYLII